MRKIYDCFLFFNEIDLLKLRMNILKNKVDYFVIVESTSTFTSKNKSLLFQKHRKQFSDFEDKIIHVVVNDTPTDFRNLKYVNDEITNKIIKHVDESTGWDKNNPKDTQWGVETYQRECIIRGLVNCNEDDIIIISDLDEIPNPDELYKLHEMTHDDFYEFKQNMYCYYVNLLKESNWSGPKACTHKRLTNISINHLRQNKFTNNVIKNGGWHFSFFGGANKVKEKIEAYSHQEYNNEYIKENIVSNIQNNIDPFFRGKLTKVDIDSSYPEYLIKNINKYKDMIK